MAVAAVVPFLPFNVDAGNYLSYLRLGAKHGLQPMLFIWSCSFLLCLWIPSLFIVRALRSEPTPALPRHLILFAAVLLSVELGVTVIAAKPGAGTHHMLPFVGYHSFLLAQLLGCTGRCNSNQQWSERPTARAAAFGVALVLLGTSWPTAVAIRSSVNFELQRPLQQAQLEELLRLADSYPRGMLGVAGNESCWNCHKADCVLWENSKHAHAWETLAQRGQQVDPDCQQCHTTGYGVPGGFQSVRRSPAADQL